MAVVLTAIVATLAFMGLFRPSVEEPCDIGPFGEGAFSVERSGANWTVTIQSFLPNHTSSSTDVVIRDGLTGRILVPPTPWSALTLANWPTYHALYEDNHPGTPAICVGDRLLFDSSVYPSRTFVTIADGSTILGTFTLM